MKLNIKPTQKSKSSADDAIAKRNLLEPEISTDINNIRNMKSVKKKCDHSNYWKIVVQDYAKKIDDSIRDKDYYKEQAIRFNQY